MTLLSKSIGRMVKIVVLTFLGLQVMPPAMAFQPNEEVMRVMRWIPVSEEVLAGMRGGFQRGLDGSFMSFGIERNVFLDEKLVSSTRLGIADMGRLADLRDFNPLADHQRNIGDHPSKNITFIQSGPGDSFSADVSALPAFMTVLQNGLDNRTFQVESVFNADVESLSLSRSLDLGNALSQGRIEAILH